MVTDAQQTTPSPPSTTSWRGRPGTPTPRWPRSVGMPRWPRGSPCRPTSCRKASTSSPSWIAYRYEDCSRILRDAKTFTSTGYDSSIGMVMGHMILGMDDPEHRTHRNLVAHAFREKSLARWEPEFIAPIVDEQIDRFAADGQADLVRQLTFEFPVRVIARLLGLPEEDFLQFQRWSIELIGLVADIDRGLAASESLREYFAGIVARATSPAGRGRHQRPGLGRGRRRAALRRGHLLLPATAAPGRGRDDLPVVGQPALPAPDPSRSARSGAGGPLAAAPGHRGGVAVRAAAPHASPGRRPATSRSPESRCEAGEGITTHIGSANHDETRWDEPGDLRHLPSGHPSHRLRPRAAHVPGHAPGPPRDPRPAQPGARPARGPGAGNRATATPTSGATSSARPRRCR